ncbi:hypothetical protein [Leptolyngbya sp. FACHB-711]|nr:hypothetical protein [Leptolyngbya sp. FACHB-711]MBD1852501.1 hypothetical protein [Cyanobacteria bacterium FACHB-502]MBD2025534.1 hypothetical protein [Leptolyngbya sp. FACHB-711]
MTPSKYSRNDSNTQGKRDSWLWYEGHQATDRYQGEYANYLRAISTQHP